MLPSRGCSGAETGAAHRRTRRPRASKFAHGESRAGIANTYAVFWDWKDGR
jgi:hypothetical protein